MKTELLETQTVDFSVGAEGLRHVPGDVIEVCDEERYKFNMPSSDAIYLHDTPNHTLFQRDARALSSGCVRVNKASELANMLLQDAGWNDARISGALKQGDTRYVNIRQNIPVNLYYLTAFVGADGRMQYRTDIYNYDLTARSSAQIVPKVEQLIR
ncbi:hypothetical protein DSB75_23145 [Salmonella enterica subsp. enterica serovar Typhimurium]|nr:hypothetical protein DSB75_23145 [Salmonella enterica subsp. enterica serovar Typhimurium]